MGILQMRLLNHHKTSNPLPIAYQRTEYIESTGEQYIDSTLPFADHPQFDVKFRSIQSSVYTVCGVRGSELKYYARVASTRPASANDLLAAYYGRYYGYAYAPHTDWHRVKLSEGNVIIDGTERAFTKDFNATDHTIALFGINNNGTIEPSAIQIAGCKIYTGRDDPRLVRDFVPCYRKSDGAIGMYDLCGSICPLTDSPFYINAGTGEFLKGDNV